jgi:hypothetical protein
MKKKDPEKSPPRYFERPDSDAKPLSLRETLMIVLATHLGVRSSRQRQEDFRRANGFHLFIAGVLYFAVVIIGLIMLVQYISHN